MLRSLPLAAEPGRGVSAGPRRGGGSGRPAAPAGIPRLRPICTGAPAVRAGPGAATDSAAGTNAPVRAPGWLPLLAAAAVAFGPAGAPAPVAAALAAETPYSQGQSTSDVALRLGVRDGRLSPCLGSINPNCVSTSSLEPDASGVPWQAPAGRGPTVAAAALKSAVAAAAPGAVLAADTPLPGGEYYLLFREKTSFGDDAIEFLLRPEGVPVADEPPAAAGAGMARPGSGSAASAPGRGSGPGALITYRSIAGGVKYLYPITTPITDFGKQRARLEAIRDEVGYQRVGCDQRECYEMDGGRAAEAEAWASGDADWGSDE